MRIPAKWIFTASGLLLLAGLLTGTRIGYTADCIRCLRKSRGTEWHMFGLRIWHRDTPRATDRSDTVDATGLPPIPVGQPSIMDEILGRPCEHVLKRSGFGSSPLLGGGVGCGAYAEGGAFSGRRYALSALAHLQSRAPDLALARRSHLVIESVFPAATTLSQAMAPDRPADKVIAFAAMLNLADSAQEWTKALAIFETASPALSELRVDPELLRQRLRSGDPIIRQTSAALIAGTPGNDNADLFREMLASADRNVTRTAADSILFNHRFELFPAMLRVRKPDSLDEYVFKGFTDEELGSLLAQNNREVDAFAFLAIAKTHRLPFIDHVVARLNEHDTPHARSCVADLIAGPNPLDGEGDAWERIKPLRLPRDELIEHIEVGAANKRGGPRTWKLMDAVKAFALQGAPSDWPFLEENYRQATSGGLNETICAVMGKGLMTLDPDRTRAYLLGELAADDHRRQTAALAGMGLIADPAFADAIDEFQKNPPKASASNPYPAAYIFKNPHYMSYIDYARHRCRGIHHWRLVPDATGRFHLIREQVSAATPRA